MSDNPVCRFRAEDSQFDKEGETDKIVNWFNIAGQNTGAVSNDALEKIHAEVRQLSDHQLCLVADTEDKRIAPLQQQVTQLWLNQEQALLSGGAGGDKARREFVDLYAKLRKQPDFHLELDGTGDRPVVTGMFIKNVDTLQVYSQKRPSVDDIVRGWNRP